MSRSGSSFDPNVDLVLVDKIQAQQVLLNLLRNAIEAMHASERRKLVISTQGAGRDMVLISFADSGPGIDAELACPASSTERSEPLLRRMTMMPNRHVACTSAHVAHTPRWL
jgi:hypothetical protein